MKCRADGCDRDATYKTQCLCQKHYFRMRRNGQLELVRSRKYRTSNPAGYQRLFEPKHPLANSNGYVYEHRAVAYSTHGDNLPPCALCGEEINWSSCHIDHIDADVTNNRAENLRPLCRVCNTFRDYPEQSSKSGCKGITFDGKTLTAEEWSREPGVKISGRQLRERLSKGMPIEQALFAERKTHKNTETKRRAPKTNELKAITKHYREELRRLKKISA